MRVRVRAAASCPASSYSIVSSCLSTPQRTPTSENAPRASMVEASRLPRVRRSLSSIGKPSSAGRAASRHAAQNSSRASSVAASPGGQRDAKHWLARVRVRGSRTPSWRSSRATRLAAGHAAARDDGGTQHAIVPGGERRTRRSAARRLAVRLSGASSAPRQACASSLGPPSRLHGCL